MTLDLSGMRTITFDLDARLVHVEPGCSPKDVELATQEQGLAVALGFVSADGVAEQVSDAHLGYLVHRLGWTSDDLEEAEIVTTDGVVRIANQHENAGVFQAIRSRACGVGIVTRMTLRAARRPDTSAEDGRSSSTPRIPCFPEAPVTLPASCWPESRASLQNAHCHG